MRDETLEYEEAPQDEAPEDERAEAASEDDEGDADGAADRGIPSVARRSNTQTLVFGGLMAGCAGIIGLILFGEDEAEIVADVTQPVDEEYVAPVPRVEGLLVVAEDVPEPPEEAVVATDRPLSASEQRRQEMMMAMAAKNLEEERAKIEKRRRSDQLISMNTSNRGEPFDRGAASRTDAAGGGSGGFILTAAGQDGAARPHQAVVQLGVPDGEGPGLGGTTGVPGLVDAGSPTGFPSSTATYMDNLDTLVPQGKFISGVLETAISSDNPGLVRAIVAEDVYSFDGSTLLVPRGSILVGQYQAVASNGQSRVAIVWDRLMRFDGLSISLGSPGTDNLGVAGLDADRDSHFDERFGAAILLSVIEGSIDAAVRSVNDAPSVIIADSDTGGLAEEALEDSLDIAPTLYVDQGAPVKVFVAKDLDFGTTVRSR